MHPEVIEAIRQFKFTTGLKYRRVQAKLSQKRLASLASISACYLSQLESGKRRNPSVFILRKIADALHCTPDQLIQ